MIYSPDGRELAVSIGGKVQVFEVASGAKRMTIAHNPFSMSYTRDGSRLLAISERRSIVADANTGSIQEARVTKPRHGELGIDFEQVNGKLLVKSIWVGSPAERYGKIKIGDELVAATTSRGDECSSLAGESPAVARGDTGGPAGVFVRLRILPAGTFDVEEAIEHTLRRQAAQPDGADWEFEPYVKSELNENVAFCVSDDRFTFRNASDGKTIAKIQTIDIGMSGLQAMSPDNKLFAVWSERLDGEGEAVEVFELATEERIAILPFKGRSYVEMRFDSSGSRILVCGSKSIDVGDIEEQRFIRSILLAKIEVAPQKPSEDSVSPGGFALRAARENLATGAEETGFAEMDVSSKNMIAVMADSGGVSIWDLETGRKFCDVPSGKVRNSIYGRERDRTDIRFSPDGNWLSFYVDSLLHTVDVSKVSAGDVTVGGGEK